MIRIHARTPAVVVSKSRSIRTVGPLALNDRLRALSRAAASLWPGLAERLGLRPEVTFRCFERSSVAVWIPACAGMTEPQNQGLKKHYRRVAVCGEHPAELPPVFSWELTGSWSSGRFGVVARDAAR